MARKPEQGQSGWWSLSAAHTSFDVSQAAARNMVKLNWIPSTRLSALDVLVLRAGAVLLNSPSRNAADARQRNLHGLSQLRAAYPMDRSSSPFPVRSYLIVTRDRAVFSSSPEEMQQVLLGMCASGMISTVVPVGEFWQEIVGHQGQVSPDERQRHEVVPAEPSGVETPGTPHKGEHRSPASVNELTLDDLKKFIADQVTASMARDLPSPVSSP